MASSAGTKNNVFPDGPFFIRGYLGGGGIFASNVSYGVSYTGHGTRAVVVCAAGL